MRPTTNRPTLRVISPDYPRLLAEPRDGSDLPKRRGFSQFISLDDYRRDDSPKWSAGVPVPNPRKGA